ncbi:MAG: hypothetical protein ACRDG3_09015, partial [Tepidiformaceae bacterium]
MPNRNEWLDQVTEEILEPDLEICDPHHHLWDHPTDRYLLDELLADTGSGHEVTTDKVTSHNVTSHKVTSTVFVECLSMYRAD